MSGKWIWIAMGIVVLLALFLTWLGGSFWGEIALIAEDSQFIGTVNVGIAAAIFCIMLFLVYAIISRRRKR